MVDFWRFLNKPNTGRTQRKHDVILRRRARESDLKRNRRSQVFTWGCNGEGQLGYGTSNSAANSVPRCVEAMKGKQLVAVAVAKYHTVVLSADGEVRIGPNG